VAAFVRLRDAAAKLGLTLVEADVRGQTALRAALDTLPVDVNAIFVPPDSALASNLRPILSIAARRGIPVSVPHRDGVAQGALFSYGFDLYAAGKQAARLADRILSGTPAADLPIEFAEMEVTLNLATADRLGLHIPDDILRHANIVGRPGE
jgi:putative ABC transport system substrate-binding protein